MRLATWLVVCAAVAAADAANILAAMSFPGPSHFVMFRRLFTELAARGHNLTVVSHFPLEAPVDNYTDISIKADFPTAQNNLTMDIISIMRIPFLGALLMKHVNREVCVHVWDLPELRWLAGSDSRFDLVITEDFHHDCMAALAHRFGAPLVALSSSTALYSAHLRMGNPEHPGYTEQYMVPLKAPFSFWGRVYGSLMHAYLRAMDWLLSGGYVDRKVREVVGADTPPLAQLVRNTSLVLVNSHWSVDQPAPSLPGFVEVGGLHVQEPRPLPPDLQRFMDSSPNGVIYFSFGSMVKTDDLPEEKLRAIIDTLASVPQDVLWKVNASALPQLPPNVRAQEWMPQNDVLYHRNVRVFITHGGLLGTQEGIMAGVPLLVVPLFADQELNAERVAASGAGVRLRYQDISYPALRAAIDLLVNDTRYRERARQVSALFRDRPRPPLEEALYWLEYVIRHRGAPHLRSAALDLAWYQYLLLDVAAVVSAAAALALLALRCAARLVLRVVRSGGGVKAKAE